MPDACRVIGKPSGSCRAEGKNQAVEQVHAPQQQQNNFDCRKCKIHPVQNPCRGHGLRHQFILLRSRYLRPDQIHGVLLIQLREHQHEHQHAHAANPMGKASPKQHSLGQRFNVRQNRRACGRKPGNRFKKRIQIIRDTSGKRKRQRPNQRPKNPCARDDDHALLPVNIPVFRLFYPRQQIERPRNH